MPVYLFVVATLVSFVPNLSAAAGPDPRRVRVSEVSYGGKGCPQGTVTAIVAPDASTLSVLYDQLSVNVGGASGKSDDSSRCTVKVEIDLPRGWSVAIDAVDVRGYIGLDRGVTAQQELKVRNGKNPINMGFGLQTWRGPVDDDFILTSIKPLSGPDWLSCLPMKDETKLEIETRLKIQGGDAYREGLMSVDSADGRMVQRYRLVWKDCVRAIGDALGGRGGKGSIKLRF